MEQDRKKQGFWTITFLGLNFNYIWEKRERRITENLKTKFKKNKPVRKMTGIKLMFKI